MCSWNAFFAAGSALTSIATQVQNYQVGKQEAKWANKDANISEAEIKKSENYDLAANTRRIFEERQALSEKKQEIRRQMLEVSASADVGAAAGGVRGFSVNAVLDNIARQGGRSISVSRANFESRNSALLGQRRAISQNARAALAGLPRVAGPSLTGLLIGVAGSAMGGAGSYVSTEKADKAAGIR